MSLTMRSSWPTPAPMVVEYGADGWSDWIYLSDNSDPYQFTYDDELRLTYTGRDGDIVYEACAGGVEKEAESGY